MIKKEAFRFIKPNYYEYDYNNFKAILILKTTLNDLEILTMNSKNLITCHTAISILAGGFDINLIDIVDKNHDKLFNYQRITSHINKYNKLFRKEFTKLSGEILNKVV